MAQSGGGEVRIRQGTAGDCKAVLNLGKNLFGGADYLPTYYQIFLQTAKALYVVAEKDGEVIGFMTYIITDDGRTAVAASGRVKPSHRSKGVLDTMVTMGLRMVMQQYPTVTRRRAVRLRHPSLTRLLVEDKECKIVKTWDRMKYTGDKSSLWRGLWNLRHNMKRPVSQVRLLNVAEAQRILSDSATTTRLFSPPFWKSIINWIPRDATPESLRELAMTHTVLCTGSLTSGVQALSFSASCRTGGGMQYGIEMQGGDYDIMIQHVVRHIDLLVAAAPENMQIFLYLNWPPHINGDRIRATVLGALDNGNATRTVFEPLHLLDLPPRVWSRL